MRDDLDRRITAAVAVIAAARPPASDVRLPVRRRPTAGALAGAAVALAAFAVVLAAGAGLFWVAGAPNGTSDAAGRPVAVEMADGAALRGFVLGRGATAVVLAPGYAHTAAELAPLAGDLAAAGHTVVTIDVRGRGKSDGVAEVGLLRADLLAVADHARGIAGVERVVVAGLYHAGTGSLATAGDSDRVDAVVALLPFTDYQGLRPAGVLAASAMPKLIVGASNDAMYSTASWAMTLHDAASEPREVVILPALPPTADLLDFYRPHFAAAIVEFLAE